MSSLRPCVECGEHIAVGDRFCPRCGAEQPSSATYVVPGDQGSRWDDILRRLQAATEGRYQIRGLIGRGGMAAVYLADWPHMDLRVAIKVMDPYLLDQRNAVQRFLQEARTIAKLNHRHIIRVFDSGRAGDLYYFCMDYYPGRSLEEVLQAGEQLPIDVVRLWLWQAADALGYAHRQAKPVVHRDIKPSNILLGTDGDLVLTDFGIAKVRDLESTSPAPSLTMPGAVLGTPAYLSPEQASGILNPQEASSGTTVTSASDQYSLGVVAYEMLVGAPPFTGEMTALLSAHASQEPSPILDRRPDCPRDLATVVTRMLAKSPEDRWPDMQEICGALGVSSPPSRSPLRTQMSAIAKGHRQLTTISLSPVPDILFEGQGFRLNATPLDLTGQPLTTRTVTWNSSDPDIAQVTQDGTVNALRAGAVCISATAEGVSGEIQISVSPIPIDTVVVLPSHMNTAVGEPVFFRTLLLSGEGHELEGREVLWTSSDPAIASIAPDGRVTPLQPGTVTLTASSEGRSSTASLTVAPPAVAAIEVTPSRLEIELGANANLECFPLDSTGSRLEGYQVAWESENPSQVTVSDEGRVHGLSPGTTLVRASCEGFSAEVKVTVARERVIHLVLLPESPVVRKGESLQLFASPRGVSGSTLPDRVVDWQSADRAIVEVDPNGLATGIGTGATQVQAKSEGVVSTVEVTVTPAVVAFVEIVPPTLSLHVGVRGRLSAEPRAPDGEALESRDIEWASSDPSLATVDPKGNVSPISAGRVRILATCEGKTATSEITVLPAPVASIEFEDSSVSLRLGESRVLVPVVKAKDGTITTDRQLSWSSSHPEILEIDATGRVSALAEGTATVLVESEGVSQGLSVEVVPDPVTSIELTPHSLQLQEGEEAGIGIALFGPDQRPLGNRRVEWSSDDPLVAEVDPEGVVRGCAPGTATLQAACEGRTQTLHVSVVPAPVSSIEIQPGKETLRAGESRKLRALARGPGRRPLQNRPARWTSSDPAIATVDDTGEVVAQTPGVARITAECESVSASTEIAVRRPRSLRPFFVTGLSAGAVGVIAYGLWSLATGPEEPLSQPAALSDPIPAALAILPGDSLSIASGEVQELGLQVWDEAGAELPVGAIPPRTWQTTDSSVVTVSRAGILTAEGAGRARVQASVERGEGEGFLTASALVVVTGGVEEAIPTTPPAPERESPVAAAPRETRAIQDEPPPQVEETEPPVTIIQILPSQGELDEGEVLQLRLTDQNDDPVAGSFRSSDPAVGTITETGTLTGIGAGDVTITARFGNLTTEATFRVRPVVVDPSPSILDSIRGRLSDVEAAAAEAQYDRGYGILDTIDGDLVRLLGEFPRSTRIPTLRAEYLEVFRSLYDRCQRFRTVMQERGVQALPTCRPPPTGGGNDTPATPPNWGSFGPPGSLPRSESIPGTGGPTLHP